jgi:glutamyl-tRNA reductase
MQQELYLAGLNHCTAPVEVRETFAETSLPAPLLDTLLASAPDENNETFVLSTCNRVEILFVGTGESSRANMLQRWSRACGKPVEELLPYVYSCSGAEAVKHFFSVASSLDSMVLGEPQVLGQIKEAYRTARDRCSMGVLLNRLLQKAFSVAKRVRSETGIGSAAVSISYAAVELAKRIFGDMPAHKAMLIGAGEMAELAATHLVNAGIKSLLVVNRTYERAVTLAAQYKGLPAPFDDLFKHLAEVDIVISSTGSTDAIIQAKDIAPLMHQRKNRPIFFIDIAVPRDIDPDVNALDNIFLYDIDDLQEVVQDNLTQRREEAVKARAIVEEETAGFMRWYQSLRLKPTIVDLIQRTENITRTEWERVARRLNPDAETREILQRMLASIAQKYNHAPITFLKERFAEDNTDLEVIAQIRRLFKLDEE